MAWELFDNIKGPKGDKGDPGTISSVSVAALEPTQPATAVLTGTTDVHLALGIPKGVKGDRGPAGAASSASAEAVPAEANPEVILSNPGGGDLVHAHFKIPRGLPGSNALPTAEAIGSNLAMPDSAARPGLETGMAQVSADPASEFSQGIAQKIGDAVSPLSAGLAAKADLVSGKVPDAQLGAATTATSGTIPKRGTGGKIGGVGTPTAADDAAPKAYVDAAEAAAKLVSQPRATLSHRVHSSGMIYSVIRVVTGGKLVPGLLGKAFANDYEKQGTTGSAFVPPKETLRSAAARLGATGIINASGWRISGNIGEMRGAQIKDGVIYHDFSSGSNQDDGAIAIRKDGRLKYYSRSKGDTAASMVADGVVHSWSWGPALVVDGVKQNIATDPLWSASNVLSAIQVIGQTQSGDIIIISGQGVSATSGVDLQTAADMAAAEGCYVAAMLDRGGSAQTELNGCPIMLSSDSESERPVPDFLYFSAPVVSDVVSQDYVLPMTVSGRCVVRARGKSVTLTATFTGVSLADGSATDLGVGVVPKRFRPDINIRGSAALNARAGASLYVGTVGTVGVINSTGGVRSAGEGLCSYEAAG